MRVRLGGVCALAMCSVTLGCPAAPADSGETGQDEDAVCEPTIAATPNLVRLTHLQYDNTIRDVFGLDTQPSAAFLDDPSFHGFDNNSGGLEVSDRLARDYRRAAEEIAALVIEDPAVYARVVPCDAETEGAYCAEEVIETLGRRLYRRGLTPHERALYRQQFTLGAGLYDEGTSFEQGVRLITESLLQSPNFLWRVELPIGPPSDDAVALDGWQLATRLSYFLWNSTPDDALLDFARSGELNDPAVFETQARRLLSDSRARGTVADFHRQWLEMSAYDDLAKDPDLYPNWDSAAMSASLRSETQLFIEHAVFELEGGFTTLLTEPVSFVDDDLAAVYGVAGTGNPGEFRRVEFGESDARGGLLTQIGFLSGHAYADSSSPIQRGAFVLRRLLCVDLPDPPANVDPDLPEVDGEEIETTREAVEQHTSPDACRSCHGLINPPGFAFEHYDAIGAYRSHEGSAAIDASGVVEVDGETLEFDGAIDFAAVLAAHPSARRCYLRQWFRYAYGRVETQADACTLDALAAELEPDDFQVRELMIALTLAPAFRQRAD